MMNRAAGWVAVRSAGMVAAAALLLLVVWRLVGASAVAMLTAARGPGLPGPPLSFATALTAGCSLLLLGCAGWWLLVTVLVGCEAIRRRPTGQGGPRGLARVCPGSVRRTLLAVCGTAVVAGVAAPASAAGGPAPDAGAADAPRITRPTGGLAGLALPDRLTATAQARRPTTLVVRPGDSLWSLARRRLPANTADAAVVTAWQALYRANTDRLGPDPDLIHPGTHLELPDLDPPAAHPRKDPR